MNHEVFITCAVTGAGDTVGRHPGVPVTPEQIARGFDRGGQGGRGDRPYPCARSRNRQGRARARISIAKSSSASARPTSTSSSISPPAWAATSYSAPANIRCRSTPTAPTWSARRERLAHVAELLPEICTLDCGTMNFALGDYVMTNTPSTLRAMAKTGAGARRQTGTRSVRHRPSRLRQTTARRRADRRSLHDPVLHGHRLWRARRSADPDGARQSDCRRARCSAPFRSAAINCPMPRWRRWPAAMSASAWRTICSSIAACSPRNGQLVERAATIVTAMGARVLGPAEVRAKLKLRKPG